MVVNVAICEELELSAMMVVEGTTATATPANGRLAGCQIRSTSSFTRVLWLALNLSTRCFLFEAQYGKVHSSGEREVMNTLRSNVDEEWLCTLFRTAFLDAVEHSLRIKFTARPGQASPELSQEETNGEGVTGLAGMNLEPLRRPMRNPHDPRSPGSFRSQNWGASQG